MAFDKSKARISTVEESIDEAQKTLDDWIKKENVPQIAASYSLLKALNPAWCKWLKESGYGSQEIIYASVTALSSIIVEVVGNVSKPGTEKEVALKLAEMMAIAIVKQTEMLGNDELMKPLPGFRRHDA